MISKNKIKYIRSLELKKNRDQIGEFVAEGPKVVGDIIARHPSCLHQIVATERWIESHRAELQATGCELTVVDETELTKASFLCHPQQVLGVFRKLDCRLDAGALEGGSRLCSTECKTPAILALLCA